MLADLLFAKFYLLPSFIAIENTYVFPLPCLIETNSFLFILPPPSPLFPPFPLSPPPSSALPHPSIALLDDWLGDDPADLLNFVPYDWRINIDLLDYEIFVFTNRYNWVDVSPDGKENGESFRLASLDRAANIF